MILSILDSVKVAKGFCRTLQQPSTRTFQVPMFFTDCFLFTTGWKRYFGWINDAQLLHLENKPITIWSELGVKWTFTAWRK